MILQERTDSPPSTPVCALWDQWMAPASRQRKALAIQKLAITLCKVWKGHGIISTVLCGSPASTSEPSRTRALQQHSRLSRLDALIAQSCGIMRPSTLLTVLAEDRARSPYTDEHHNADTACPAQLWTQQVRFRCTCRGVWQPLCVAMWSMHARVHNIHSCSHQEVPPARHEADCGADSAGPGWQFVSLHRLPPHSGCLQGNCLPTARQYLLRQSLEPHSLHHSLEHML